MGAQLDDRPEAATTLGHRTAGSRFVWPVLSTGWLIFVAAVAMAFGALHQAPCLPAANKWCSSDMSYIWLARGLGSHALPYIHGGISHGTFTGHEVEYPVLTGMFMWLTALGAHSRIEFCVISMLALAPFGLLSTWLLSRLVGGRTILFAATPTLALYAFLNWDLLPVTATIAAFAAWRRDRYTLAAGLLAAGACFKVWPGYLLVPLLLELACIRRWPDIRRSLAVAAVVVLGINLPFALINFGGFRAPFTFQSLRPADFTADSIWDVFDPAKGSTTEINALAALACAVGFLVALAISYGRFRREGGFPFLQCCAAMVAAFIVLGKVHSPQYALWVLPFFALLRLSPILWVAFLASDLYLFLPYALHKGYMPVQHAIGVIAADVVLLIFATAALRSEPAQPGCRVSRLLG